MMPTSAGSGWWFFGSGPFYPGTNGPTIAYLQRLASYGVHFHSYTEAHLSTDNELVRDLLLAVLSSLARQELNEYRRGLRVGWLVQQLKASRWADHR
jgi:DNA invertase Pin-like site-specific DNA recombinase